MKFPKTENFINQNIQPVQTEQNSRFHKKVMSPPKNKKSFVSVDKTKFETNTGSMRSNSIIKSN